MKILITGGTYRIGKGVAKILAGQDNQNHEVIILDKSRELGLANIRELKSITKNNKISFILCDLSKLSDVKNAINEIENQHEFLDGLFINAGIGYAEKRVETEEGMDSHFQINYLSQFLLTLNLLALLEKSEKGGRIVFNVFQGEDIFWDDLQLKNKWSYEKGINQAMVAKRMFYLKLHALYNQVDRPRISFFGFIIPKKVWSNQVNITPGYFKLIVTVMKLFGAFISIEKCGQIASPLFTETQEESLNKSGKLIAWDKDKFIEIKEEPVVLNLANQDRLWKASLELCNDKKTIQISQSLFMQTHKCPK